MIGWQTTDENFFVLARFGRLHLARLIFDHLLALAERRFARVGAGKLDERKAARASRRPIDLHLRLLNFAVLREKLRQIVVRDLSRDAANKYLARICRICSRLVS